jgi:hypothetical protein
MRAAGRMVAKKRVCASLVVPHYARYYEQVLGIGKKEEVAACL